MASTLPAGVIYTTNQGGTTLQRTAMRLKGPGDQAGNLPAAWAPQGTYPTSDYGEAVDLGPMMFGHGSQQTTINFGTLGIDAHSSGNGIIPPMMVQGNNLVLDASGPNAWFALSVSLAHESTPTYIQASFWDVATGPAQNRSAGSHIASYYLSDSLGIHWSYPGASLLETTRENFGFGSVTTDDIEALDYGIGVLTYSGPTARNVIFTNVNDYYFSVNEDYVDWFMTNNSARPAFTDFGNPSEAPPHPGVIYRMLWDEASGSWSAPAVHVTAESLGFMNGDGNVDALEVEASGNRIIFSATKDSTWDNSKFYNSADDASQIMSYDMGTGYLAPARDVDGTKLTSKLNVTDNGNDADELDGACGFDPEALDSDSLVGIPIPFSVDDKEPLGISIVRSQGLSRDNLMVHVTGWGDVDPQLVGVRLRFSWDVAPSTSWHPQDWALVPGLGALRTASQNTTEFDLQNAVVTGGVFRNLYIWGEMVNRYTGEYMASSPVSLIVID
ncbi:hypothetical protein Poly30_35200 [Planctomycetes bacterium Poly30]|uniref:Uncharacterized protein n=1 Tax=Saltatorellus ferox TaxID=2528018 RepID=A0A518EV99_9BACT|nr:hypothetical protein Poly30_35200 [Planctomycetes bacterium Poly30]